MTRIIANILPLCLIYTCFLLRIEWPECYFVKFYDRCNIRFELDDFLDISQSSRCHWQTSCCGVTALACVLKPPHGCFPGETGVIDPLRNHFILNDRDVCAEARRLAETTFSYGKKIKLLCLRLMSSVYQHDSTFNSNSKQHSEHRLVSCHFSKKTFPSRWKHQCRMHYNITNNRGCEWERLSLDSFTRLQFQRSLNEFFLVAAEQRANVTVPPLLLGPVFRWHFHSEPGFAP